MSGLGDLVVNLSANTQGFDKGIDKAKNGLNEFGKVGPRSVNPVTRAFSALTAVAVGTAGTLSALSLDITKGLAVGFVGAGAAAWALQSRIGDLAGVADKAAQTGLSGAFLQRIEFAADQSGVSAETLTGGIKKLTVMIGQASSGSKEAADSLKSFGLNAKDLQTLSPEQQFLKIADKISDIPTAAGRAAAAVKIFGKSGIEMTGLFAGGLDDITKLMQDAKDIGIGLDDEQLAQVAAADDSLQKMYASISAMVDQVAVGLAPAFDAVSEKVTGLVGPVTKLFDTFNNMDNKWSWMGDTLVASFDVAIEKIKVHWSKMISDLMIGTADFGFDVANFAFDMSNPGLMAKRGMDMAREAGAGQVGGEDGLAKAEARLAGLMDQFKGAADENKPIEQPKNQFDMDIEKAQKAFDEAREKNSEFWLDDPAMKAASAALDKAVQAYGRGTDKWKEADQEHSRQVAKGMALRTTRDAAEKTLIEAKAAPAKAAAQDKFTSGISSMFDKLKDSPLMGTIDSLKMGAEGMIDRAKIQAGAIGGTLSNMFADRKKQEAPRLAGAMAGGSVEAYSTIVHAMMTRGKDPVVAATEKQTKELIKGLKPKREFKNIDSFVNLGP